MVLPCGFFAACLREIGHNGARAHLLSFDFASATFHSNVSSGLGIYDSSRTINIGQMKVQCMLYWENRLQRPIIVQLLKVTTNTMQTTKSQ